MKDSFFVIEAILDKEKKVTTHYRLTVANKAAVEPYNPFLPSPAVFAKGPEFRDFLLLKSYFLIPIL